ncbi:MAG: hypothetical protein KDD61_02375 [Bdellovibrionales bacterium]|nr:hypothetical protein [Bdellovibrionales bacterium]
MVTANRPILKNSLMLFFSVGTLLLVSVCILFWPDIGLKILWYAIVPTAPLLMFFVPNLWVNICPFANIQGWSRKCFSHKRIVLEPKSSVWLKRVGWLLFLVLVPLRIHFFNSFGHLVVFTIALLLLVAFVFGQVFEGLSGWCEGMCPVGGVERMYSLWSRPKLFPLHCQPCSRCVRECGKRKTKGNIANKSEWEKGWPFFYFFPGFLLSYFSLSPNETLWEIYGNIGLYSIGSLIGFKVISILMSKQHVVIAIPFISLLIYYYYTVTQIIHHWFYK